LKFVDCVPDHLRLIDHLLECKADRQRLLQLALLGLQGSAEIQTVELILHDHIQHQCRFPVMMDQKGGGVLVAAPDVGNVRELHRPAALHNRRVSDLVDGVQSAVEPDVNLLIVGVD